MAGYPMGSQAYQGGPPPQHHHGMGGPLPGYGGPPSAHHQYAVQPGMAPPPNSQQYGSYGQHIHQNIYGINAWQVCSRGRTLGLI